MKVRTRIAPSPTGYCHVGTIRTALYNYLFAKQHGGTYILRLEDTDAARNHPDFEKSILKGLDDVGLIPDEGLIWKDGEIVSMGDHGPYRQSLRTDMYTKKLKELADKGLIYPAYETKEELEKEREDLRSKKLPPRYSGAHRDLTDEQKKAFEAEGRVPAWRLRVDEKAMIEFEDLIRGSQKVAAKEIGDIIIARSLEDALYNFAVVVDDIAMDITHVIRGEDHISNTAKQVLIYNALGVEPPKFAHIPLILNPDRSKMSKRKSETRFEAFMEKGILPEAMLNYLALLGWNAGDDREIYSLEELIDSFSLERVQKGGAIFDITKLEWMNGQYLNQLGGIKILELAKPFFDSKDSYSTDISERILRAIDVTMPRYRTLYDVYNSIECFIKTPTFENPEILMGNQADREQAMQSIAMATDELEKIQDWSTENIKQCLFDVVAKLEAKNGPVFWPVRVALTNKERSPGPDESAWILGKKDTIARLKLAHSVLSKLGH